jgi:two-component system, cell cycle sensor histidine kinase and response regulator CckA
MYSRSKNEEFGGTAENKSEQFNHSIANISDASIRASMVDAMYAKAFAINPAAIGIVNMDTGLIVDVNKSWQDMFRCSSEEAIGKSAVSLRLWPRGEDRRQFIEDLINNGSFRDREYSVLRKTGENFVALCSAELMTLAGEKFIVSTWLDITDRTRAEQELHASEAKYRIVAENTFDWEFWVDPHGCFLYCSPSCARVTGYKSEEFLEDYTLMNRIVHPEDRKQFLEHAWKALSETHLGESEFRILKPDGTECWIGHVCRPVFDEQRNFLGIRGTNRDITERKRAENALSRSQKILTEAQRQTHIGSFEFDFQTDRLDWSEEMFRICGVEEGSFEGHRKDFLDRVHPEDRLRIEHIRSQGLKHTGPLKLDFRILQPSGETRFVRMTFETTFNSNGAPLRRIGTVQDITETKKAEEDRAKLESQLQQAQRMESVGRLAGGVAHDFNNMLSVILGNTELALGQLDPAAPIFSDLKEIKKAAERSADLTRQLLAFARKQTIVPRVLDLNAKITEILNLLKRLIGENIELSWLPEANLWPIRMDASQIDQILTNLCVNARDAINDFGKIAITTENSRIDENGRAEYPGLISGEYVLLSISDNGCGMESEIVSHIFEPFYTTKGFGEGTGLGLATVYGIVKQNSGYIYVKTQPGKGTAFEIYLPRCVEKLGIAPLAGDLKTAASGGATILFVEDEPLILKLTTRMLDQLGYFVLPAATPNEALQLARNHPGDIHIMMTDVIMPEMNGRELAEKMLSLFPRLKCIFTSGWTSDVITRKGVLDPETYFLQKPFSIQELAAVLERARQA